MTEFEFESIVKPKMQALWTSIRDEQAHMFFVEMHQWPVKDVVKAIVHYCREHGFGRLPAPRVLASLLHSVPQEPCEHEHVDDPELHAIAVVHRRARPKEFRHKSDREIGEAVDAMERAHCLTVRERNANVMPAYYSVLRKALIHVESGEVFDRDAYAVWRKTRPDGTGRGG